jgi:hypothetical protein
VTRTEDYAQKTIHAEKPRIVVTQSSVLRGLMTGSEVFLQQVLNGLTVGSYLALIALGYTLVYGIIGCV